jgi:hypothetical protein
MTTPEGLGPAERIINTLLAHSDHMVHGRPGVVTQDGRTVTGVRWAPVTHKVENDHKVVYRLDKVGRRTNRTRIGVLRDDGNIVENGNVIGRYQPAGIFPEVAVWMYRQIAEVWKMDNEFAAKWASYAYKQEHRDLKVALAAFLLVQSRRGEAIREDGKILFYDEDYRDVGEAMMLLYNKNDRSALNPKLLVRIHDLLSLPGIAEINRELGFGRSARKPFLGRWTKATNKWLEYREGNRPLLDGLVKAGYRQTVMDLSRKVGYKPETDKYFEVLRWKQKQANDGRRTVAIGKEVAAAETWDDLNEEQICQKIESDKPNFKRIVGMVPKKVGLTRAIVAAAIEAGSLSDKDLVIYSPTLEELGLLQVQNIRERWESALKRAEDQRAANIAGRMKTKEAADKLQDAADTAVKTAVEEVLKDMRVYFFVDISGSMSGAIEAAKSYLEKFVQGFPRDRIHIATFNTSGHERLVRHASAAGVQQAFAGVRAGGGTDYGAGVQALQRHKPQADEDVLFIFVGDEQANPFAAAVRHSGLNPLAFGLIKVVDPNFFGGRYAAGGTCVQETAAQLGIPCFKIESETFQDPYSIPRTIRALVAATPVGQVEHRAATYQRVSLIDQILQTDLLKKPVWA